MRAARAALLIGALTLLLPVSLVAVTPAADSQVPAYHPTRLTHVGDSRQVLVVTAAGWHSTHGLLRAYRLDSHGHWHKRFGAWRVRFGYAGLVRGSQRKQATGTTPAGTFRLGPAFGSRPDPGTALSSYRRFDNNDWWVYDPRDATTYNMLEPRRPQHATWRRRWAEHLSHYGRQYSYVVVIGFNLPGGVHWSPTAHQYVAGSEADTRRGGGIFLHVNGPGATAGCVSMTLSHMRRLLRWLDSKDDPRIVIGPRRVIDRM